MNKINMKTKPGTPILVPNSSKQVIEGCIPEIGLTLIEGETGTGKSFVAVSMACSIASGLQWEKQHTQHGVVVYLNSDFELGIKLAAWCKRYDIKDMSNLIVINGAIYFDSDDNPGQKTVDRIKEIMKKNGKKEKIAAIFIDRINDYMWCDVDDDEGVTKVMNSCRFISDELETSVVVIFTGRIKEENENKQR